MATADVIARPGSDTVTAEIPPSGIVCGGASSAGLASAGGYSFLNINVEAYPDSASAITDVVAEYSEVSAEEGFPHLDASLC